MTCEHSLAEKEAACADGMCPFCAAARAELAQMEVAWLKAKLQRLTTTLQDMRKKYPNG
jgi:hypothetical protein